MTDEIENPAHYEVLPGTESITIIASAMSPDEWRGFCFGNIIKYRLRAGKKGKAETDLAKADFYLTLYERHKHLCRSSDDQ